MQERGEQESRLWHARAASGAHAPPRHTMRQHHIMMCWGARRRGGPRACARCLDTVAWGCRGGHVSFPSLSTPPLPPSPPPWPQDPSTYEGAAAAAEAASAASTTERILECICDEIGTGCRDNCVLRPASHPRRRLCSGCAEWPWGGTEEERRHSVRSCDSESGIESEKLARTHHCTLHAPATVSIHYGRCLLRGSEAEGWRTSA